ncbi:phage tail tape measure protein [Tenacibaculum finnmarkense]|uniref:phage tail tape measure protein n=3 Tax=Tenacibaculum finnmarkense TaxID=2781243 RepID=UPI001EFBFCC1|nr:phage tail tape measure protein [Tenacibaculum finnmarkense]MCG8221157.1 phage tail tape measure protein [Tenacibaculum finnmarkense genomovar finnmarkense]MCG8229346.1 phage tail tape measure protein [Tenacibaculum finnmarkense genomovar finnmarkense]MCG8234749.1 phage tail tape measure protein [Tenacibaculum finnmarkense genomovar finnmarkense]MCG8713775.1 phage tail tape measure protein [Tenacibaculum finnmarkense]MCG8740021.1 phage tail tape measure protein [Tenacibaculum finnmarkense]
MAKSKMTMLLELQDKFSGKLKILQGKFNKFETNFSKKIDKLKFKYKGLVDEIPGLGRAMDLLKNPMALATVGILGVGIAFGALATKGVQAAEKFDTAFLPIKQLNLEKSKAELDSYRSKIRDAAFDIGTNLGDSTNAMYDLQSATGLYGKDAIDVFKKVGRYSQATGADLGDSMNSTTKAMKAFGIGVNGIDALLASNAKTVQTGITSFDRLAKVQTVFGGAAKMAGQDVDQANKMFAMFTSLGTNESDSATLTKSFFEGLRQNASKIEKELKISLFDENENMRKADAIMKDAAKAFVGMSDKKIMDITKAIGGPDGLQSALGKAATASKDMNVTFDAFDSSKFSLSDALKNAEGDFGQMKKTVSNRLEMVFSKIGEKIIPLLANLFDTLAPVLEWLYQNIDWLLPAFGTFATILGSVTAAMWLFNIATAANPIGIMVLSITALIFLVVTAIKHFDSWGATVLCFLGPIGMLISAFVLVHKHWDSIVNAFKSDGIIGGLKRIGIVLLDVLLRPLEGILKVAAKLPIIGKYAKSGLSQIQDLRKDLNLTPPEDEKETESGKETVKKDLYGNPIKPKGNIDPKKTLTKQVNKVVGDAKQTRNISITIDALNKGGINLKGGATQGMTLQDVENWFNEAMMRVIRNAETS